ncbi:MAG: 50S ribosomal protein L25/general stress protein Ctc, partial [Novosphingobium sp.]
MSEALTLAAETRERAGKGASRALRREGRVPCVVYGGKEEPLGIHVEERALQRLLGTGHFSNSLVMIEVGGASVRTLPKDVAFHPVSDRPLHVDFLRLGADAKVEVAVPVVFVNEDDSPGLKRGGVLNVVRHELDLVCDADKIPEEISI